MLLVFNGQTISTSCGRGWSGLAELEAAGPAEGGQSPSTSLLQEGPPKGTRAGWAWQPQGVLLLIDEGVGRGRKWIAEGKAQL